MYINSRGKLDFSNTAVRSNMLQSHMRDENLYPATCTPHTRMVRRLSPGETWHSALGHSSITIWSMPGLAEFRRKKVNKTQIDTPCSCISSMQIFVTSDNYLYNHVVKVWLQMTHLQQWFLHHFNAVSFRLICSDPSLSFYNYMINHAPTRHTDENKSISFNGRKKSTLGGKVNYL